MLKFVFLDDNDDFLQEINKITLSYKHEISVDYFSDIPEFIAFVNSEKDKIDGAFIDISLQEVNGIDIAERIYGINPQIRIVYVTGYVKEYCQNIFLDTIAEPYAMLTKPVNDSLLFRVFDKFFADNKAGRKILIKTKEGELYIDVNRICYLESCNRNVIFQMNDGSKYETHGKISSYISVLGNGYCFSHQSFYVNLNQVVRFNTQNVVMSNDKEVPISRKYQKEFKVKLLSLISDLKTAVHH